MIKAGVAHSLSDLPNQVEPVTRTEALALLREVVIQALGAWEIARLPQLDPHSGEFPGR
jgi:hypothetical protein